MHDERRSLDDEQVWPRAGQPARDESVFVKSWSRSNENASQLTTRRCSKRPRDDRVKGTAGKFGKRKLDVEGWVRELHGGNDAHSGERQHSGPLHNKSEALVRNYAHGERQHSGPALSTAHHFRDGNRVFSASATNGGSALFAPWTPTPSTLYNRADKRVPTCNGNHDK